MTAFPLAATMTSLRQPVAWGIRRVITACIAASGLIGNVCAADGHDLTVYTGYRSGGSFKEVTTGKSLNIESSPSFAVSMDFPLDYASQFQIFYSYQDSNLHLNSAPATPAVTTIELPMQVMYLHIGGTNFFSGEIDHGAYLVGGLGATLFAPQAHGYSNELRASLNLGVGYHQPLGKRLALRVEARGYFTLVNSSGGLFCNGGCLVTISGTGVTQGELSVGLAFGL